MVLSLIKSVSKEPILVEESLVFKNSKEEFWSSNFLDRSGFPVSGGFASSKEQARKIATSEYIERNHYRNVRQSDELSRIWGCEIINTACGFAAGFDKMNTIQRSVGEAVERWVMSKWIDEAFWIEQVSLKAVEAELDDASRFFLAAFDEVWFFRKTVPVSLDGRYLLIDVGQTMGFKDGGIFPGSSAQYSGGCLWQHSLLESYRHLLGFRNNPPNGMKFPTNKVHFFAKNASVAIAQIRQASNKSWPIPRVKFHRCESFNDGKYFIARTIVDGWRSWHEGSIERFLY